MQDYYIKKAKECEATVALLQRQIDSMNKDDALKLQEQMDKVCREMSNYNEAVERVTADV